ncbi:MAG: TonB-dependent receptor [Opitutus sp.]|nr:TonB-dependent receptor [Opitutus sp.]
MICHPADPFFPRRRVVRTDVAPGWRVLVRTGRALALTVTFIAAPLWSQATTTKTGAVEPAVQLSPFEVTADQPTGYAAQDTLSGSRTRTALKDVASAVGVYSRDLIDDLAAVSEKDLMAYSASAVPEIGDQTASGKPGLVSISPPESFGFRIRGQAATRTRNYFDALVPPDSYNIARFEEARGPNALLFGMGGAGGILNQTTKRANPTRPQTDVALTYGRHDLMRAEFDHNQVLSKRAAVRINALAQRAGGARPYEFNRQQRADVAATLALTSRVKVFVEFERGSVHHTDNNSFGAADAISLWLDRGRPTQSARTANAPQGIALSANQQIVAVVTNDGAARNFQQTLQSTTDATRLGAVVLDRSLMTRDPFLRGPGNENFIDFQAASAFLEIQAARHLFFELAADHQSSDYIIYGTTNALAGDPGTVFRDGTANPYAGSLYFDTSPVRLLRKERLRTVRATMSYALDLRKWGRHNLTVMAQDNRDDLNRRNTIPVLLGSPFNAVPSNARNRIFARSYVTNPGDVRQYQVASWRLIPTQVSVVVDPGTAPVRYDTGWINLGGSFNDDWSTVRSYLGSTQGYFFKDRLVASWGYRRDERHAYTRPPVLDPRTNEFSIDYGKVFVAETVAAQNSLGLVYHLTPDFSLLYNQSKNAQVPANLNTLIPNGGLYPLSRGRGRDAGFTVALLQGKISARVAYFETSMIDTSKGFTVNGNVINRNSRILDTMITDGTITSTRAEALRLQGSDADLLDRRTTGFELSLTANATSGWRVTFNASQGKAVETNMLKRTKALMPDMLALWHTARQTSVTSGAGAPTIAREIVDFQTWFDGVTAVEGRSSLGDREWQAKFFNRYSFSEGRLHGWYVGGGWRYQSAPIVGTDLSGRGFYRGESVTEVDALIGHQVRASLFGRKTRLTIQFNGNDLLHRRDYLTVRRDTTGRLTVIRILEPSSFKLQAKLGF